MIAILQATYQTGSAAYFLTGSISTRASVVAVLPMCVSQALHCFAGAAAPFNHQQVAVIASIPSTAFAHPL